ncbi:MAG TPA: hypothetical protein VJL54_02055 [Nitrososphaera sp.]|nr:hypothetical protein [Nitrososphaera sp.]
MSAKSHTYTLFLDAIQPCMVELKGRIGGQATKCKSCGTPVDARLVAALTRVERSQRIASRDQIALLKSVTDLKAQHAKDFGKITKSQRKVATHGRKYAEEIMRRDRIFYEQELFRLRSAFASSIAQLKDAYVQQSRAVAGLRAAIMENSESIPARLESLAEANRSALAEQRDWLEQTLPATLLDQLGSAVSSAEETESERDRLANDIAQRDTQIEQATERIGQLEAMLAAKQRKAIWKRVRRETVEPYKDEPQVEPQKEILDIIREIAQERKRMTAADEEKANSLAHFADSFGSRMSAKIRH